MYFDFGDNRPDTPTFPRPISSREGVLLSIIVHLIATITILVAPHIPWVRAMQEQRQQALEQQRRAELERLQRARFVFVQPRIDMPPVKPPPLVDLSDRDGRRRTVERANKPTNALPMMRGNSPELVESPPAPKPDTPAPEPPPNGPAESSRVAPPPEKPVERALEPSREGKAVGVIADAIRNVRKYVQQENFENPQGGANQNLGESIQFDSKGVEFGPWLRRFRAQVYSNWFFPQAAWSLKGHVILTFNIHKDGRITDVTVVKPSTVDAFTFSARNAILASNPTIPLPAEYPSDKVFFTVIFYFNEPIYGR
jgi:TonB family protein